MFHWPLEFPEVIVKRGGFDAFVGNPPFLGGMRISSEHGEVYERALKSLFENSRGTPDLCCYFLRQGFELSRQHVSCVGMLSTNSIVEGDSRRVGLQEILEGGGEIYRVRHAFPWPGQAGIIASYVFFSSVSTKIFKIIDDQRVETITSYFNDASSKSPEKLKASPIRYTQGYTLYGSGFIIDASTRDALCNANPRSEEVIFPYLNADLFNNSVDGRPERWAINFGTREREEAEQLSEAFSLVERLVSPERKKQTRQVHEHRFWLYWDKREKFFKAVASRDRILVSGRVTKYLSFRFYDPNWVFSEQLKLFDVQSFGVFSLLQSSLHDDWARQYSSTLGQTLRYSTTHAFETFPFPTDVESLEPIGKQIYEKRESLLASRNIGLTDAYNLLNNSDETSEDIQTLRGLQIEMDQAVAVAYGWGDLALGHGFHETKQGIRYTISEPARRDILQRLLKLNHERYENEVKQGLHDKKKPKSKRKKKQPIGPQLFE